MRRESVSKFAADNAAEENAWNRKQSGRNINLVRAVIRDERKQTSGRNERDQAGALRQLLIECKEENEKRYEESASSTSEETAANTRNKRRAEDADEPSPRSMHAFPAAGSVRVVFAVRCEPGATEARQQP